MLLSVSVRQKLSAVAVLMTILSKEPLVTPGILTAPRVEVTVMSFGVLDSVGPMERPSAATFVIFS